MLRSLVFVFILFFLMTAGAQTTRDMYFNAASRRNAASVYLRYALPDSIKAIAFYNEITIPSAAAAKRYRRTVCWYLMWKW